MSTWLNPAIEMRFRTIDGLSIRFAQSEDRDDHAIMRASGTSSMRPTISHG